jgi:predicted RNA-binding protein with RPS1 domain
MKVKIMSPDQQNQMELSLEKAQACPSAQRRRRTNRASWWFQRMRQVVDKAIDWQTAPSARPEQIYFPE